MFINDQSEVNLEIRPLVVNMEIFIKTNSSSRTDSVEELLHEF
jgi:hypothetical protein